MKLRDNKKFVYWALAGWTLLNLLQGMFTELFHDEAYYWVYSQNLDWGYFDHPPMIALMIWIGSHILPGEIGVRLLVVASSTATIYIMYLLAGKENPKLFFAICFSILLVHIGGLLAAPDIPVLLFGSLFFLQYRNWLKSDNLKNILLLGLAIALLLYSKYHGMMILFFTILSNLKILNKKSFWMVVGLAVLLYLPHLWWMFENGFSSFVYHLGYRSKAAYTFNNTWEYITGELAVTGPLVGIILLPAAFLYKTQNEFERALKWCFVGIFTFLLLMTFDGRVEANWAALAFIPMIVLSYRFFLEKGNWRKWLFRLAVPSMLIILIIRIYFVWDFAPDLRRFRSEFHGWPEWAEQVEAVAGDAPVVFPNTYKLPAKYAFYSGHTATSYNSIYYRGNQYDKLSIEEEIQGKRVLLVGKDIKPAKGWPDPDSFVTPKGDVFFYRFIDNYRSYLKFKIEWTTETPLYIKAGRETEIPIRIINPYDYEVNFAANPEFDLHIYYRLFQNGKPIGSRVCRKPDIRTTVIKDTLQAFVPIIAPAEPGEYEIFVSLQNGWLYAGRQGQFTKLVVE